MLGLQNHGRLFQYLATFSATFSVITSGINLGWTSPYLPQLQSNSSTIPTTSDAGSWCAVMPLLGAPPGALMAALLADRIGRKHSTLLLAPVVFSAFVGIAFADSILLISALRFVIGATEGALYTVLPMYIGEISQPDIRGFLTSTIAIAGIAGTLLINVIGPYTSIFTSSLLCTLVPLAHFAAFVWMPESPYYYIKKRKYSQAQRSLRILRSSNDIRQEYEELKAAVERQESEKGKLSDLFTSASNRKACLIFVVITVTSKFSGKNPCMFYTATIFEQAGATSISSTMSVIVYCSVELVATLLAMLVVDRFGKRPLLMVSTLGCAISIFFLGGYFYAQIASAELTKSFEWLPITALVLYNVFFSAGLAYAPVAVLSELFPTSVKAAALGAADSFSVCMGALASKFFQITMDAYGLHVPFWAFSCCCFVGLGFIVKFVPETKGKSLEEVQKFLMGHKSV